MRRLGSHRIHGRMVAKLSIGVIVLLICTLSLLFSANVGRDPEPARSSKVVICGRVWILSSDFVAGDISSSCGNNVVEELWESAESGGWRPSSAPRSDWPPPTEETNGYLRVRCNGGLNQQRSAVLLAARIMNATLVLPELDANSFWHDDSGGFQGIYDVEHFIETLKCDVKIVGMIPDVHKKIKAFQAMTQHSAIYLTPFSHRLAEEIDNPEYQRLRCRVNYHALRFKLHIMKLSDSIVDKPRSHGHFMSIHLRFEMDMLAFAGEPPDSREDISCYIDVEEYGDISSSCVNNVVEELWESAESGAPTEETNGYLRVRCNGCLNQQRSAYLLPELDANSLWHDDSGFLGIYDVEHFIDSLNYDVKIVGKIPDVHKNGKTKKIKAFQIRPPRDAPIDWYLTTAPTAMKEHSAIYLAPFSHRLAEEIDNPEYQRLRCRVNYHALRFKPHIMKLSDSIVDKLRSQGHFMSIHLRFEMDMLAFAGCFDIFNPEEQKILKKYPGELFGGERFMKPFRTLFPRLDNHSSVDPSSEELSPTNSQGLIGSAVDYMTGQESLAPVFVAREKGKTAGFEEAVRRVMMKTNFGGPHRRVSPESFYTNSWPECFCQVNPKKGGDKCPPDSVLDSRLENVGDSDSTSQTDSTVVGLGR
ncbi:hypothetical protein F2Q69_00063808 [Brassica cretica]|uniref:O-fucosyltransferase family protein n=1 Tax=Brassica cretica TaxID=69181 RepID=A0A8S9RB39_BRACR|nr:hypothetical protein F2Q69_00063808 [Brassica cretica]